MYLELCYHGPRGIEEGFLLSMPQFVHANFFHDSHVVLCFSKAVFEIEGRGARQIVEHLKRGTLSTIQEWNANRWPEPGPDEPKITRIAYLDVQALAERGGAGREREKGGDRGRS
jgi:hypothetical protein